jgi:hypothetical protein
MQYRDIGTITANRDNRIAKGGQNLVSEQTNSTLLERLERLPANALNQRRFFLGKIQGLKFGIIQFPHGSRDVFVK